MSDGQAESRLLECQVVERTDGIDLVSGSCGTVSSTRATQLLEEIAGPPTYKTLTIPGLGWSVVLSPVGVLFAIAFIGICSYLLSLILKPWESREDA